MNLSSELPSRLELAVFNVADEVRNSSTHLDWNKAGEFNLWVELVSCILGSRVSFEHAKAATEKLATSGLLEVNADTDFDRMEQGLVDALSERVYPPFTKSGTGRKYRYPVLKANHIRQTAESIYGCGSLKQLLQESCDGADARRRLMNKAKGIGPKQASLFLRNAGYADNLAVLDVHVLKYMFLVDLLPNVIEGVSSIVKYEKIEGVLRSYCEKLNAQLALLDLAIWVVMRVYTRDFA